MIMSWANRCVAGVLFFAGCTLLMGKYDQQILIQILPEMFEIVLSFRHISNKNLKNSSFSDDMFPSFVPSSPYELSVFYCSIVDFDTLLNVRISPNFWSTSVCFNTFIIQFYIEE